MLGTQKNATILVHAWSKCFDEQTCTAYRCKVARTTTITVSWLRNDTTQKICLIHGNASIVLDVTSINIVWVRAELVVFSIQAFYMVIILAYVFQSLSMHMLVLYSRFDVFSSIALKPIVTLFMLYSHSLCLVCIDVEKATYFADISCMLHFVQITHCASLALDIYFEVLNFCTRAKLLSRMLYSPRQLWLRVL